MKIIPINFTQEEFENEINKVGPENITCLCISINKNIRKVPYLPNLKELNCHGNNLFSIPLMEKLEKLCCYDCLNLFEIPNFPNLKTLICSFGNISSIPPMENLELLECNECENLCEIPYLPKLKKLSCYSCPDILEIPYLPNLEVLFFPLAEKNFLSFSKNLKILFCSHSSIKSIPPMEKLEQLQCHDCPNLLEIPNFPNLRKIQCDYYLKIKFYNKDLEVNNNIISFHHFQGRLFQNTYRTYELLIF